MGGRGAGGAGGAGRAARCAPLPAFVGGSAARARSAPSRARLGLAWLGSARGPRRVPCAGRGECAGPALPGALQAGHPGSLPSRRSLNFSSLRSDCADDKGPAKGDAGAEYAMRARKRKADVATVSAGPARCPRASARPAAGLGPRGLAAFCWGAGPTRWAGGRVGLRGCAPAGTGGCHCGQQLLGPRFVLRKSYVAFCSSYRILMKKLPKWR